MEQPPPIPQAPPIPQPPVHRCPDCDAVFLSPSTLVDHSLTAHVSAPTPAAHIRATRHPRALRVIAVAGIVLGVACWVLVALAAGGIFNKESAPESPGSVVHKMAVDLEESGEIDDYRAVEPDGGWDVEYELDGGDGYIRVRNEGEIGEELEVYGFGALGDAVEEEAEERGFIFED